MLAIVPSLIVGLIVAFVILSTSEQKLVPVRARACHHRRAYRQRSESYREQD